MPELDYKKKNAPSKEELAAYLNESQIFPLNINALWFELLKLINRVNNLETNYEKNNWAKKESGC